MHTLRFLYIISTDTPEVQMSASRQSLMMPQAAKRHTCTLQAWNSCANTFRAFVVPCTNRTDFCTLPFLGDLQLYDVQCDGLVPLMSGGALYKASSTLGFLGNDDLIGWYRGSRAIMLGRQGAWHNIHFGIGLEEWLKYFTLLLAAELRTTPALRSDSPYILSLRLCILSLSCWKVG